MTNMAYEYYNNTTHLYGYRPRYHHIMIHAVCSSGMPNTPWPPQHHHRHRWSKSQTFLSVFVKSAHQCIGYCSNYIDCRTGHTYAICFIIINCYIFCGKTFGWTVFIDGGERARRETKRPLHCWFTTLQTTHTHAYRSVVIDQCLFIHNNIY